MKNAMFLAAMLLIASVVPVVAEAPLPSLTTGISGTYAVTGSSDCIEVIPPATFDSAFRATDVPVFHTNAYMLGYRTFRPDGTGDWIVLVGVSTFTAVPPDTATPGSSSASSWEVKSQFTYTFGPNGIITMVLTPNSYLQTFTAGGRNGQTLTQDVFNLYAYVTPDGMNLSVVSKGAEMETRTFSNGDIRRDVCTRGYSGHKI
jgi:hypothetical protein